MLSRPRSLLFWLVLIILLYIVATAPTELADTVLAIWHATKRFFNSLDILIDTLETS
ncbi:hypothetical protein ACH4Y0_35875 [Streptomyces sp. NPDC020707]|uniref:Uncharacterized protein n=2 Tax=Streptomyces TaxID=1883 RepID=A0ABT3VE58_9ACTN|nr:MULTISPECIES: hypothetical protein [Streptomyces]MCW8096909.1 hypothetical protein [Streptomyces tauricus]MCX4237861.1 hypothetical protein [Streptomyces ortus]WSD74968.1 hypothetical protein OHB33_00815 [Streptomyces sp. NBC_01558]